MSTKSSVLYGKYGHVFREQGEGAYYWEGPSPYEVEHEGAPRFLMRNGWYRLPFRFFWRWLERREA